MRTHVTQREASIQVLTFKQGLLSRIAHDLRLRLARFELELDAANGSVTGRFFPETLRVEGALRDGRLDPSALSERDQREIEHNVQDKILHVRRHASIDLEARAERSAGGYRAAGTLAMLGRSESVTIEARLAGGRVVGEVELRPSRWGIAPFKALLGAIQLQDRVLVRFDLPAPDEPLG
jgi:YceI-like domain